MAVPAPSSHAFGLSPDRGERLSSGEIPNAEQSDVFSGAEDGGSIADIPDSTAHSAHRASSAPASARTRLDL